MKKVESSLKLTTEELKEKKNLCEVKRWSYKYIFDEYNFVSNQKLVKKMEKEKSESLKEKKKLKELVMEKLKK